MTIEEKVNGIVAEMTVAEKLSVCSESGYRRFGILERFGIDGIADSDSSVFESSEHENQNVDVADRKSFTGTAFPTLGVLAATWDKAYTREMGRLFALDCKQGGIDMLCRPGINIKRSPLSGRNFEFFSEDPVLSGELGAAMTQGIQSVHVAANVKHYAVNVQEYDRMRANAVVSERTLREVYLRAFEIAIKKGQPWTIMTSYNRVNNDWVNSNCHLMKDILRGEWGYDGVVVSDGGAIHTNKVEAHLNGLDVEFCGPAHRWALQDAYNRGEVPDVLLNDICRRVLTLYFKILEGRDPDYRADLAAGHSFSRKIDADGTVLLKNDGGILPLDPESGETIAVVGGLAEEPNCMGGGCAFMSGNRKDQPLSEIRAHAGNASVLYAPAYRAQTGKAVGSRLTVDETIDETLMAEAVEAAKRADKVIAFVGLYTGQESEGFDRFDLQLPRHQIEMLKRIHAVNENVIVVLSSGSAVDLREVVPNCRALLEVWLGGESAGGGTADVLFGAEPGGRLPETFPMRFEDIPSYLNNPNMPEQRPYVVFGEEIFVGYRWYEARKIRPMFPFGFGLSYTQFAYSDLRFDKTELRHDDVLQVSFRIKNTGNRPGKDVAQLYVRDVQSSHCRPEKELKAFETVRLAPGEETTVTIALDRMAFEFYSDSMNKWVVEEGAFEILIGRSVEDTVLSGEIYVHSPEAAFRVNRLSCCEMIERHPRFPGFRVRRPDLDIPFSFNSLPIYRCTERFDDIDQKGESSVALTEADLAELLDYLNGDLDD